MNTEQQQQGWDRSGLKEACQRALKLGRTHQETDIQLFLDMLLEIERLESIVKGQEADDDGSLSWCDDCHGYTHKYDCPNKQREAKTPLTDRIVDAVYRSMARYESGEWWLDTLKAKARVKRLLAESDAATSMRSLCVEKVKAAHRNHQPSNNQDYEYGYDAAMEDAIKELESLTLQEQKS